MKIEKLKVGQVIYDVKKYSGLGSYKWSTYPVKVLEIDLENRTILASWNGNKPRTVCERHWKQYRYTTPKNEN